MDDSPSIGYLLKQAQSLLHDRMDEALRPHDLTVSQYSCLYRLSVEPGISAAGLARATFVTRQSMTTMLDTLRQRALVERAARAAAGRALPVRLTKEGVVRLAAAHAAVDELESRLVSELGPLHATALSAGLVACVASLGTRA